MVKVLNKRSGSISPKGNRDKGKSSFFKEMLKNISLRRPLFKRIEHK